MANEKEKEKEKEPAKPEVKQAAILSKAALKTIRVAGLRGSYGKLVFNNDSIAEGVDAVTEAALREQFGDAVEEV